MYNRVILSVIFAVCSIFCSLYIFKYYQISTTYQKLWKDIDKSIVTLQSNYSNWVYSSHDNEPIPFVLAQLYSFKGDYERAEHFLNKAIDQNPVNERINVTYARFLMRRKKELSKVPEVIERLKSMNTLTHDVYLLESEWYLGNKEWDKFLISFKKAKFKNYYFQKKYLTLQLLQNLEGCQYIFDNEDLCIDLNKSIQLNYMRNEVMRLENNEFAVRQWEKKTGRSRVNSIFNTQYSSINEKLNKTERLILNDLLKM